MSEPNSLYGKYVKQLHDWEILEDSEGFLTYNLQKNEYGEPELVVRDIYTSETGRKKQLARAFWNQIKAIAKSHDCKYILGIQAATSKVSSRNLLLYLYLGCQIFKADGNNVYLIYFLET